MYYFPELREDMELANFEPDQPIEHDYLVATFHGNTSQVVGLYYHPRFCLRVLDPDLDPLNPLLPEAVRKAAALSSTEWITVVPQDEAARPPEAIFGAEPAREGWCFAFEQADLARQQGEWVAGCRSDPVSSGFRRRAAHPLRVAAAHRGRRPRRGLGRRARVHRPGDDAHVCGAALHGAGGMPVMGTD